MPPATAGAADNDSKNEISRATSKSDSKYFNLPDIDTAPDVYETPDAPEDDNVLIGRRRAASSNNYSRYSRYSDEEDYDDGFDDDNDDDATGINSAAAKQDDDAEIQRTRLSIAAASARFKSMVSQSEQADHSGAIKSLPKKKRVGGLVGGGGGGPKKLLPERGEYSILPTKQVPSYEPETRLQRLRRLMFEVQELGGEIDKIKEEEENEVKPDDNNGTRAPRKKVGPAQLLKHVNNLQSEIGRLTHIVEEAPESSLLYEGDFKASGSIATHNDTRKTLMTQLSTFKTLSLNNPSAATANAPPPSVVTAPQSLKAGQSNGDFLTYELYYTPENARMTQLEKTFELDARVAALEKLIGIHILQGLDNGDDSVHSILQSTGSLSAALDRLEHHLSLLTQPRMLDGLNRKLKSLIADMEKLLELRKKQQLESVYPFGRHTSPDALLASGSSSTPTGITDMDMQTAQTETEKRVWFLFKSLEKLHPIIGIIPHLVSRLQALQSLHTEAATFADSLKLVTNEQIKVTESSKSIEASLKRLEENMKENAAIVERNMQSLDQRIVALMEKAKGS
ncbi:Dynactin subunit 2 [Chytridiales sp. JEL 0842]|nr:Dynactin subunit 2 [Chytridiales sp. JEL 0842]